MAFSGSHPQMRNAAAKAVWPLCEPPRATSMAPVGVSRTKIPPYPPATASRGVPAPMSCYSARRFDADRRANRLKSLDPEGQIFAPNNRKTNGTGR